jgi:hypothetical protein
MSSTKTKNIVAVAILVAVGLCLGAIYYSGEQLGAGVPGPSKIGLAPDGTVWVASHGGLHHFTQAGARKEVVALSALGRGSIISELLPLSDGTLVLAEAVPSAAYRCNVATLQCATITAKIAGAIGPTAHALMIAADEKRSRFYISDNANHRLILLDFDGKVLDVTAPGRVLYPNELAAEKPGQLVVVDTTHRRLVRIRVERDAFGPDLWQMKTDTDLARLGRRLPMDLAPSPDGGWWVLIARDGMKEGDLILFGSDGKAAKRVDLGLDSDPTQIAMVPDGLLVADPTRATLTRIAPDGSVAGPWGDSAFQAEVDGLRASRSWWRALRFAAQILLVAFPIAGVLLLWRLGERLPVLHPLAVPASPTPVENGIHWLEVRPEFRRRARYMLIVLTALIWSFSIAAAVIFVWGAVEVFGLTWRDFLRPEVLLILATLAAAALVPVALLVRALRAWRMRLGTDGGRFFLDTGKGKVEEHSFSELATSDGRQLLVGRRLISLHLRAGPLFAEEELRGYVFARIPPSGRLDPVRLLMRALGQGNRELWWTLIGLAIAALFLVLPALYPAMAAYFKAIAGHLPGAK